jgi:hypothetical protein
VNLVVQKILAVLDEADDPEVVDYYLPNKDLPFHYDPESDTDLRDLESERCIPLVEDEADEETGAATMTEMAAELASLSPLQKVRRDFSSHNVLITRTAPSYHNENLCVSPATSPIQDYCRCHLQGGTSHIGA